MHDATTLERIRCKYEALVPVVDERMRRHWAASDETGLVVRAALDTATYPKGIKVSDEERAQVKLTPAKFHGEWNYSIAPRTRSS